MDFGEIAIVATLVFAYALASAKLDRSPITAPMVFCFGGLILGTDVLGAVELGVEDATVGVLAEATLVLVLFSDASRIDLRMLRRGAGIPVRLLTIGFPLTLAAGLVAALVVFPSLSVWEAGLLAVILTPTDAALGQAVVSAKIVPVRVRQALNVESGLNDGLAVPVLAVMLAGAVEGADRSGSFWARFVAEQIGYGVGVGLVCGLGGGYLVMMLRSRNWMNHSYAQIAPLSLAAIAFGAASAVDGNGFLAAFVAGLAFGSCSDMVERVVEFAEEEGQLLAAITFFLFGAVVAGPAFEDLDVRTVVYAVLSLTVVRMLPVRIALLGSGMNVRSVAFIGWFGPRGLASIIFAIEVAEAGDALESGHVIASVVTCVVLMSILAHGFTAAPLSRAYGTRASSMTAESPELAEVHEMPTRRRMDD